MQTKIFLVYNLFNSLVLHLVPKKLRTFLPPSWYQCAKKEASDALVPTRMDDDELGRVFQTFDWNGDGRITKKELNDSLENMGIFIPDAELSRMIEKIDGNGSVDIDEFGSLCQNIMVERDVEEDMREAFNVFDQNGDGFITVDELKSVLAALGLRQGRAAEDCKKMITRVDRDGDGRVDFSEFKQMMARGGFAA